MSFLREPFISHSRQNKGNKGSICKLFWFLVPGFGYNEAWVLCQNWVLREVTELSQQMRSGYNSRHKGTVRTESSRKHIIGISIRDI